MQRDMINAELSFHRYGSGMFRPIVRFLRLMRIAIPLAGLAAPAAWAQVDCGSLAQQIDALQRGGNGDTGKYESAARRQRGEIDRTAAYMRSIGCNRQQFFIFGSPPPPQCADLGYRMQQMQANLSQLEAQAYRSGGSARAAALQQSYDYYCRGAQRGPLDEVRGLPPLRDMPVDPDAGQQIIDEPDSGFRASGGSAAVCVRTCDGGFFPMPVSARRGNLEEIEDLCRALCPNTEARLFTMRPGSGVASAVSTDGASYSSQPFAFKFQKSFDKSCTCKPPDKSWAEALGEAEKLLGRQARTDIIVTPEKAEELSRPRPAQPASKNGPRTESGPAPQDATPLLTRPSIAHDDAATSATVGPDGVRRTVRRVGPRT